MANNFKIVLRGHDNCYHEGTVASGGTPSPGMAVAFDSSGTWDETAVAQAAALKRSLFLATEASLKGYTVDNAYAAGDVLFLYACQPGDIVQVLVKDGESIAIDDDLVEEGGGSGLFVEAAGTEAVFRAVALEAVSPSGSNGLCKALIV